MRQPYLSVFRSFRGRVGSPIQIIFLIMIKPKISVVLPVYNGEAYLKESIESILNQTFTDFELIIINDGSTDNSKNIINSFSDERIKYIEQNNKGLACTLNIAAFQCNGKYIVRMDQDDLSAPNRFFIQFNFLEKHPDISVLSGAVSYIDATGKYLGRSFPITCPLLIKKSLLYKGCVVCHPSVIMRKKDFDDVGGYSEIIGGRFTDYHLWVKFVKKSYKIQNLSKILLQYRVIESSMTSEFFLPQSSKKIFLKVINDENPNLSDITELYNACKINEKGLSNRSNIYNNKLNYAYLKLPFLGENIKNYLFCEGKNFAALFNLNL